MIANRIIVNVWYRLALTKEKKWDFTDKLQKIISSKGLPVRPEEVNVIFYDDMPDEGFDVTIGLYNSDPSLDFHEAWKKTCEEISDNLDGKLNFELSINLKVSQNLIKKKIK